MTLVLLKGESEPQPFRISDWWDRLSRKSWMTSNGVDFVTEYAIRAKDAGLPLDNEVVYGTIDLKAILVHETEIVSDLTKQAPWQRQAEAQARARAMHMRQVADAAQEGLV